MTRAYHDDNRTLHYSKIAVGLKCPYLYFLIYVLGLRRRWSQVFMDVGDAAHVGLCAYLRGGSPQEALELWVANKETEFKAWTEEMATELAEDEEVAAIVMQPDQTPIAIAERALSAVERTADTLDIGHRWETVSVNDTPAVEFEFSIPFEHQLKYFTKFQGALDWLAREVETGHIFLWDHKLNEAMVDVENADYSLQAPLYLAGMKRAHPEIPIAGFILHQIRSTQPKIPKLNKDRSMSRVKILTTWNIYKQELKRNGLNPDAYEREMRPKLEEVEWFRQHRVYRSDVEIEEIWANVVNNTADILGHMHDEFFDCTVEDIHDLHPWAPPRAMHPISCKSCSYREPCMEGLRGGDVEFLLKTRYMHKDDPKSPKGLQVIYE